MGNWKAGNGFVDNATVKAQQVRIANMKASLGTSREAMTSVARAAQAAERGVAGELKAGNPGVNWKTVRWGVTEIVSGALSVAGAIATSTATGGISTIPASWAAYTGILSIGTGVVDVMLGVYGQPTAGTLVADALKNDPFARRITYDTTEL